MRRAATQRARIWLIGAVAPCLFACASSAPGPRERAVAAAQWAYGRDAVIVDITTDPELNAFEGQPHTLALFVLQASEQEALRHVDLGALAGVRADTDAGTPAGIVAHTLKVLHPGESTRLVLDRAQRARWIGIVAGYAARGPQTRMFGIPLTVRGHGALPRRFSATPAPLAVRLRLGATSIADAAAR